MKQDKIDKIRHDILLCKMRLKNLEPHIENSPNLSEIYNKVIIEKALLHNQLRNERHTLFDKFAELFKPHGEKRICDYFN